MSDVGKAVIRKLNEKEVVCRELTVDRIRQLLGEQQAQDVVSAALFEEIALGDLPLFTNLSETDIGGAMPSQLEPIVEGCKEANPHFFGMLTRLQATAPKAG